MEIKHETVALYQRQRKPRRDIFRGINRLSLQEGQTYLSQSEKSFTTRKNINGGRCGRRVTILKTFFT